MTRGSSQTIDVLRIVRDDNRTRVDVRDGVLGYGVRFPSGLVYCDWRLESYPPENRLDNPHVSMYGSLDDLRQGTGGSVEIIAQYNPDE